MDLGLYARVVWRFRIIVAVGLALALALAVLSYVKVSFAGRPHITYRQNATWQSQETFLITARGVPWAQIGVESSPSLSGLSAFYAHLANSDAVQRRLLRGGPIHGTMSAQDSVDLTSQQRAPLPFISIIGTATSPSEAISIARRGAAAFRGYLVSLQAAANVPESRRVQLEVLSTARKATLVQGRKKTLPIVIFLTVMVAAIGLAFILENLKPRVRVLEAQERDVHLHDRQSA
jgi:hypothetical protein